MPAAPSASDGPQRVTLYFDYKSPYAFLAKDLAYELERETGAPLEWQPYTLDIPAALDAVETRSATNWRKVRYAYMDVRRHANRRGLTTRGPRKIFDSSIAHIGMLYAKRHDGGFGPVFRGYHDRVFERFFKRELDIEQPALIETVLAEAGADTGDFAEFLAGEGRAEHDAIQAEALARGVFGVPMFVYRDELFWGQDRIGMLRERIAGSD